MSDEAARIRAGPGNNAAFIARHLVDARAYLLKALGSDMRHPFGDRLEAIKTIDEATWYPSLEEVRAVWNTVSAP